MAIETLAWWAFLCTVSAVNVAAWVASAVVLRRRGAGADEASRQLLKLQLLLSAGYVLGCAFRSVLPVFDVPRQVMHDSWLSSVAIGRTVATVAELCFAAQGALLLREAAAAANSRFASAVARVIVPAIALAEVFSWHAVLTTANLGHIIEESIWASAVAMLVAGAVATWPRCHARGRRVLAAFCLIGCAYVAYMVLVDVPMYWARWVADEAHGRRYLDAAQGAFDVATRWHVTGRWEDWRSEALWMGLYFSVAVWLSIALVHASLSLRQQFVAALRPASTRMGWWSGARDELSGTRLRRAAAEPLAPPSHQ